MSVHFRCRICGEEKIELDGLYAALDAHVDHVIDAFLRGDDAAVVDAAVDLVNAYRGFGNAPTLTDLLVQRAVRRAIEAVRRAAAA